MNNTSTDPYVETLRDRKGARKREDIPAEVLEGLHEGWLSTVNLIEWLAVDMSKLLRAVLQQMGRTELIPELGPIADGVADQGVMQRIEQIGIALYSVCSKREDGHELLGTLATHPADVVRNWATFALVAAPSLSLTDRLVTVRSFAADAHFGVRECSWMSVRPALMAELDMGLVLLQPWVVDADANVRRFAVEGTRPRGVWCPHMTVLKQQPELGLPLLEPVRTDPSRYVQLSVANWLNDASKSTPDWVRDVCERWQHESPTKETKWITNHALRTLRKQQ